MNKKFFIMLLSLVIMASAQLCSAAVPVEGLERGPNYDPDRAYWVDRIAEKYGTWEGIYYPKGRTQFSYVLYHFAYGEPKYENQALSVGCVYTLFYYDNGTFYYTLSRQVAEDFESSPIRSIRFQDRDTIILCDFEGKNEGYLDISGVYKRKKFIGNDGQEFEAFAKFSKFNAQQGYGIDDYMSYNLLNYETCCAFLTFLDRNGDLSGTDF